MMTQQTAELLPMTIQEPLADHSARMFHRLPQHG